MTVTVTFVCSVTVKIPARVELQVALAAGPIAPVGWAGHNVVCVTDV